MPQALVRIDLRCAVCHDTDESHGHLRSMLVRTSPLGAIPLVAGVVEVCWHVPCSLSLAWVRLLSLLKS
jgi:hypothetical protein